jgi:RNA polymerase sigma factor (TIGR02999 family)
MTDFDHICSLIDASDQCTADQLLPLVYEELRRLAAQRLSHEKPGQTLNATALVHEVYLRLLGNDEKRYWNGRNHFFAAAAESMRRILVDNARRKLGPKRGGRLRHVDAYLDQLADVDPNIDLLALDEALTRPAEKSPARAELVKLRFFAGMTTQEAADVLGISLATAERYWTFARAQLYADLLEDEAVSAGSEPNRKKSMAIEGFLREYSPCRL